MGIINYGVVIEPRSQHWEPHRTFPGGRETKTYHLKVEPFLIKTKHDFTNKILNKKLKEFKLKKFGRIMIDRIPAEKKFEIYAFFPYECGSSSATKQLMELSGMGLATFAQTEIVWWLIRSEFSDYLIGHNLYKVEPEAKAWYKNVGINLNKYYELKDYYKMLKRYAKKHEQK